MYLEHTEAQFFRILTSFFGSERVIPSMSVLAVCCGELPVLTCSHVIDLPSWAKSTKCLFTVVDQEDTPKVVFEFFNGFERYVDVQDIERQQLLRPLLESKGISYITIRNDELDEILDPQSNLDFYHWLKDKVDAGELVI